MAWCLHALSLYGVKPWAVGYVPGWPEEPAPSAEPVEPKARPMQLQQPPPWRLQQPPHPPPSAAAAAAVTPMLQSGIPTGREASAAKGRSKGMPAAATAAAATGPSDEEYWAMLKDMRGHSSDEDSTASADAEPVQLKPPQPKPPPPRMPVQPRQTWHPPPALHPAPHGPAWPQHLPGHPPPRSPAAAAAAAAAMNYHAAAAEAAAAGAAAAASSSMRGVAPSSSMRQPPHPWKEFAPSSVWSLLDMNEEGCTDDPPENPMGVEPLQMKEEEENELTTLVKQQAMVQ